MSQLSLTPKMKQALERLYELSGQEDWLNMYTADALERRGLVAVNRQTVMTHAGAFPYHKAALTATGAKWCERYFAVTRRTR